MNLIKKNYFLFLLLLLMTFGCRSCDTVESTKIAQSEIYQDYSVDAADSGTRVTATFRVGGSTGTTIDLDAPSKVEHNGREMGENLRSIISGTTYTFSSGVFTGSHQFTYTNGEGKVFLNELSFEAIEMVSAPAIINSKEKTVILLSRPVYETESLETSIDSLEKQPETNSNSNSTGNKADTDGPSYSTAFHQNYNSDRTAIVIEAGGLKDFVPGKAEIVVKIRANKDLQQKNKAGGWMSYTYSSKSYPVNIKK
jgi:hypothetical protein